MPLSMDQLMPLTEASPLFDQVEAALRKRGHKDTADALLKLQQDAGIELEKEFGMYDPKAGPETAKLDKAYKETSSARCSTVLQKAHDLLPASALKTELSQLKKTLVPEAASPAAKFKGPGR